MKENFKTFPRRQDDKYWNKTEFLSDKFASDCTNWRAHIEEELQLKLKRAENKMAERDGTYSYNCARATVLREILAIGTDLETLSIGGN